MDYLISSWCYNATEFFLQRIVAKDIYLIFPTRLAFKTSVKDLNSPRGSGLGHQPLTPIWSMPAEKAKRERSEVQSPCKMDSFMERETDKVIEECNKGSNIG